MIFLEYEFLLAVLLLKYGFIIVQVYLVTSSAGFCQDLAYKLSLSSLHGSSMRRI